MESKEPPDIVSVDTTVRDGNGNIEDKENCPVITFNDDVAENVEHEDAETKDVESTQVVTTEVIEIEYLEAESKENKIENLDRIDTEIVSSERTENEINCDSNTYVLERREESQTGNENIESINQINEETCIIKSSEKFKEIEENIKKTDNDIRNIDFCKETKKTITLENEHTESVYQNMEEKIEKSEEKGEEIEVSSSIENCGASMQENKISVNKILSDISLEKIETEEAESFLSATPDIVKVCDIQVEAFEDENPRCQQVNNELQQVDEAITYADRESPIHQLHTSQLEAEVLSEPNGEASADPINGTIPKEMIVDLIPEPIMNICKDSGNESKTRKPSSVSTAQEKLKRGQTKQLQEKKAVNGNINKKSGQSIDLNTNRQEDQTTLKKNTTRKNRPKSTTIAGNKIDLISDKAQYLHLTLEQIQQLAMQQNTPEKHSEQDDNSNCALHFSNAEKANRGIKTIKKKSSTKTERDQNTKSKIEDIDQIPDIIREAESSTEEKKLKIEGEHLLDSFGEMDHPTNSTVRKSLSLEDKRAGRSASVVRQNNQNKNKVTEKSIEDKKVPKRANSKVRVKTNGIHVDEKSKGGLLAPTQSWLLHIGKKQDFVSKSPSLGPKEQKRSFSVATKLSDRSPSPKRKLKDPCTELGGNRKPSSDVPPPTNTPVSIRRAISKHVEAEISSLVNKSVPTTLTKSGREIKSNSKEKFTINESEGKDTEIVKTLYGLSKTSSENISSNSLSASATLEENQSDQNDMGFESKTVEVSSTSLTLSGHLCETSMISSSVISDVEETSISATEVKEMIETESKAFITTKTNASNCFQQDSVTYVENVTKENGTDDLRGKEECSTQGLVSLKSEKSMADTIEVIEMEYLEMKTKENRIDNSNIIDSEMVTTERIENEVNCAYSTNLLKSKQDSQIGNVIIESLTKNDEENLIVKSFDKDLECVIEEAQVIESIMGDKELRTVKTGHEEHSSTTEKATEAQKGNIIEENSCSCNVEEEESASLQSDAVPDQVEKTDTIVETCIEKNRTQSDMEERVAEPEISNIYSNIPIPIISNVVEETNIKEPKKDENMEGITRTGCEEKETSQNELNIPKIEIVDETLEAYILNKKEVECSENSEKLQEIEEDIPEKKTDNDVKNTDFCKEETENTESCPNVVEIICETKKIITLESESTEYVSQTTEERIEKTEEKVEEIEDKIEETEGTEESSNMDNCEASMQENTLGDSKLLSAISLENIETEEALQETGSSLSPTPDIVRVSDIQAEAFDQENPKCQQVNNGLQQLDEAIRDADMESPIHQLNTSQLEAEVLSEPNTEASADPINGTESKEMIVGLIPEPVINIYKDSGNESKTRTPSSVSTAQEKLKRGQTKQLQEKKAVNGNINKKSAQTINLNTNRDNEQKTSKNTTRKDSSMSTTITGHKIDLNSVPTTLTKPGREKKLNSNEKVIINGSEGKDTEIAKTLYGLNGDTELIPKNPTSKPKNLVNSEKQETKKSKNSSQKISSVSSSASATVTETQSDQNSNEVSSTSLIQSEHMCETSMISSSIISGVEETSISATEVIEMFETESKAFITSETNSSSCFQQDLVTYAENVTKEHRKEDLTSKEKCSAQGLPSLKTDKIMKDSEIVEKVKKSKSSTKSVYSKSNNGSSNQAVKSNRSHSRVGDKSTRNGTHTGNTEETNKKPAITLVTDEQSEKMATKSDKSDMKSCRSRSQGTNSSVSTNKSATFVKDSTVEQTNGTATTNSSTKTRTTMIVRLYPGQSKRISAYLDQQPGDQSAIPPHSVAGDVQYEDTPGSICGLEISFTSVPQDIDVKLIHAGNTA